MSSMSCSPSSGRSASVWVSWPGSSRSTVGSSAAIDRRRARSSVSARAERQERRRRPSSARGARTTCSRRGCMVSARGRAAPDAVGGEPAGDPGRLRLELGVGDLGAVGDQRGPVGAALAISARASRRVSSHAAACGGRRWLSCPIMPHHATRTPRPRRSSTRRSSGPPARRVRRHPLREGRRDREDHDRPARGPQRLPAADPGRALAPPSSCAREDPEVGVDHPHRRRRQGLLLGRRPERPRRQRLHGERGRLASAASTSPTCRCRCGGCRSRWSRWSPATRSAAATSSTSAAT